MPAPIAAPAPASTAVAVHRRGSTGTYRQNAWIGCVRSGSSAGIDWANYDGANLTVPAGPPRRGPRGGPVGGATARMMLGGTMFGNTTGETRHSAVNGGAIPASGRSSGAKALADDSGNAVVGGAAGARRHPRGCIGLSGSENDRQRQHASQPTSNLIRGDDQYPTFHASWTLCLLVLRTWSSRVSRFLVRTV